MTSTPRHPATQHLLDQFGYDHLPPSLQAVSKPISDLKDQMAELLADGPELSAGLRKLLEAKDCLVRQRVDDLKAADAPKPVNTPEPELTRVAERDISHAGQAAGAAFAGHLEQLGSTPPER